VLAAVPAPAGQQQGELIARSTYNRLVCEESSTVSVRRGKSMKEQLFRTRAWGNLVLPALMGAASQSHAQDAKAEDNTYEHHSD